MADSQYGKERTCVRNYTTLGAQERIVMPCAFQSFVIQLTPTGGTVNIAASINGIDWIKWTEGEDGLGEVSVSTLCTMALVKYVQVTLTTAASCELVMWGV